MHNNNGEFYNKGHTEETKLKIKLGNKGVSRGKNRVFSLEHRNKISEGNRRRKLSEETKLKISKANKGRKRSESFRLQISLNNKGTNNPMFGVNRKGNLNPMFGKRHSEESKEKMRKAKRKTNG